MDEIARTRLFYKPTRPILFMCGCLPNDPNCLEKRQGSKQGGLERIDLTLKSRALLLLRV